MIGVETLSNDELNRHAAHYLVPAVVASTQLTLEEVDKYWIMLDYGMDSRVAIIKDETDVMDCFRTYVASGGNANSACLRVLLLKFQPTLFCSHV